MELYQGMGNKKELQVMKKRINYFDILQVNSQISKLAIYLIDEYNLSHGLTIPDAIIGASAIIQEIELYTYNIKDFKFGIFRSKDIGVPCLSR
ncbi:MAG: type II toxin-antitoxin system VapC family toxin [Bacteroidota bacterium]